MPVPPFACDPPVADLPPVAGTPPVAALPPVGATPPVDGVPPFGLTPPVAALPPVEATPPVNGAPPVEIEPPLAFVPPVAAAVVPPVDAMRPPVALTPPVAGVPPVAGACPPVAGKPPVPAALVAPPTLPPVPRLLDPPLAAGLPPAAAPPTVWSDGVELSVPLHPKLPTELKNRMSDMRTERTSIGDGCGRFVEWAMAFMQWRSWGTPVAKSAVHASEASARERLCGRPDRAECREWGLAVPSSTAIFTARTQRSANLAADDFRRGGASR